MRKSVEEEANLLAKRAGNTPHVELAHCDINGGSERTRAEKTAKRIKHFMDKGDSFDVAASKAHRLEQVEADLGLGSHSHENRKPPRGMTASRLNGVDGLGEEDSR